MVHRIRINRRRLLGPEYFTVSANTTTWVSGATLVNWTNSNVYPTSSNPTNYPSNMVETNVTNTVPFDQTLYSKSIVIPLELKFEPTDYSDIIDNWVDDETQRVINDILDGEKAKYVSTELTGFTVNFRFYDRTTTNYNDDYASAGFVIPNEHKLNRFKKSYFRLYFYDSNNSEKSNLLFTEDLPVEATTKASFVLKRLFWDVDDELMVNNTTNRTIYMEARFFNAKTGQVQTFYNLPTTYNSPIGISLYSNVTNRSWRTSPIVIVNPNNVNGEYRFGLTPAGGTTNTTITMSEFVLT